MDNIGENLNNYWNGDIFLRAEEFDGFDSLRFLSLNRNFCGHCSWGLDGTISNDYGSGSPGGSSSSNIVAESHRRKKLNERLFALRAVVPNITKMDKASIIKDAIDYIQELKERDKILRAEIEELESFEVDKDQPIVLRSKKRKAEQLYDVRGAETPAIEVLDLSVAVMGEKTMAVSLTCRKRRETIVKLCEVFETMRLKLITASIIEVSGRLCLTLFIEAEEEDKDIIKLQIEMAIAHGIQ